MSTGKALHAKLFLEGKEVPFIGATVTHTVGQAAIAYIDLVPHKTINNIKPRTLVHLFIRDFNNKAKNFPYVLAYEGEVFGYNFGKTPTSRSFSISCIDYSSYWDNVLTYFFNAQQSLGKGAPGIIQPGMDIKDAQATGIKVNAVTHSRSSFFLETIKKTLKETRDDGTKKDFLDAFVKVYENISKINDFYSLSEERLRIVERIVLKSSGELTTLLKENEALEWLSGLIGRQSGFSTLRMVIQDLMSLIFHDYVTIPFPGKVNREGMTGDPVNLNTKDPKTIGSFVFKPNLYMVPPPACNVFFPEEYSNFQFNRNFFQEPTRLIYKPEMPRGLFGGGVALPHVYQPDSFEHFMQKKESFPDELIGDGSFQVSEDPGLFGDDDEENSKETNQGKKREAQFLTNEEKMKGILMAQESMVPASTQFRAALTDVGKRDFASQIAEYMLFKKRFQGRQIQISGHLKFSVVPGFTVLILDDSDADQTVMAYCSSVTHRIYATQGGYTNTTLSYARTVDEQDVSSGKAGEPIIPPWFSATLFGEIKEPTKDSDAAEEEVKNAGEQLIVPEALSEFYASLLGSKGSNSINTISKEETLLGASRYLVSEYRKAKAKGVRDIDSLISKVTRRDYVKMSEAFGFLDAYTKTKDQNINFLEYTGKRFAGKVSGQGDADQIELRRDVIDAYRKILKERRGFRG